MSARRPSNAPVPGFLEGGRAVTVTREEHHADILVRLPLGATKAELTFCVIYAGKYRGRRGIEVRLAGLRVGELTFRMSERYAGLVEEVRRQGGIPTCAARVDQTDRGRQVTVWLPDRRPVACGSTRRPIAFR
jgi:hypothetical protein